MADGASKLDKLARLKNLKSGLKAQTESSGGGTDDLSLGDIWGDGEDSGAKEPAPASGIVSKPVPVSEPARPSGNAMPPKSSGSGEQDSESLSAYFEALGIVPDGAKLAGATGIPPKPYVSPSDTYTNSPEEKGRDVDIRDRWPDPVREDDTFLTSFAGAAKPQEAEEVEESKADEADKTDEAEEEVISLESIIGSFDDDEEETGAAVTETVSAASDKDETVEERVVEDDLVEEIAAAPLAEPPQEPSIESLEASLAELEIEAEPVSFGQAIDIEAFEKEIGVAGAMPGLPETGPEPVTSDADDADATASADAVADADAGSEQPLSITFDETRATLLAHVSKQMNCSIDDVVVTAIDWYLDALFGEDDPAMKADVAE